MALSPSSLMRAPSRASSCTCMKRFSKIVSVMRETPDARVISAMNCACRSVEGGERRRRHVDGGNARAVAGHANALRALADLRAGRRQCVERGLQQIGPGAGEQHVAAGHRHRHGVGAGFDAVRHHGVARAVQLRHALDFDRRLPRPQSARPS